MTRHARGIPLILMAILLGMARPGFSQPVRRIDRHRLEAFSTLLDRDFRTMRAATDSLALTWDIPRIVVDSTGVFREFVRMERGRPVFYQTHNRAAAMSIGTAAVQPGGRSGLDLTGSSMTLGLWDGGGVRLDHVEFGGRVDQRDTIIQVLNHSTHVAGTMIASGVREDARGMAVQAHLEAYDWSNDAAEMALAAARGLQVSNHSYGTPAGWVANLLGDGLWGWMGNPAVDPGEDFRFGLYGDQARIWDELAVAAPEYLIVKSAGNERADSGPGPGVIHYVFTTKWELVTDFREPDGGSSGYDTILDSGVAKNVLTIGGVEDLPWGYTSPSDVRMADFSGWGPTDDGRIKPDLVANGVHVLSSMARGPESYGTSSGTSMATPSVAGSAALLQELFMASNGGLTPLASTMKALLIHTAEEAGSAPGPDYRFGWGLVNTERAAALILADRDQSPLLRGRLIEDTLLENTQVEYPVLVGEGEALRVTLAWTDPAAEASLPLLDPTARRLVNDLDLEVTGPDGPWYPWILDPANPESPASAGVNTLDNVEQVVLSAGSGGTYTVRIRHSGSLTGGSQVFSVVIGDPAGSIRREPVFSISGRIHLSGVGMNETLVLLSGAVSGSAETTRDGVYTFTGLPPGAYTVTPVSDVLTFGDPVRNISLMDSDARVDFAAVSPLVLDDFTIWTGPNLLHKNETDGITYSTSVSAGGVYGSTLSFLQVGSVDLTGGSVEVDWAFDPLVVPFAGLRANRFLDASPNWLISSTGFGRWFKRIPALWMHPDTPAGYLARIPFQVLSRSSDLIYVDTLRISVDRPDDVPPLVFPELYHEGRDYILPGQKIGINISLLDGSPIVSAKALLLDRNDLSRTLVTLELHDSGDLSAHRDEAAGDGIYSALFIPQIEADFRLAVVAVDAAGNRVFHISERDYSSRPFVRTSDILLMARDEHRSETDLHRAVLTDLGFDHNSWEYTVRGQMPQTLMDEFPIVIWSLHDVPLIRSEDMAQIEAYISNGGRLLIFGEHLASRAGDPEWLSSTLHVRDGGILQAGDAFVGEENVPWAVGFRTEPVAGRRPDLFELVDPAIPVLHADGSQGVLAAVVESGNSIVIVSSVSLATILHPSGRADLITRMLYGVTLDDRFFPGPGIVRPVEPLDDARNLAWSVRFSWSRAALSTYRLQIASTSDFSGPLVVDTTAAPATVMVENLQAKTRFYWRVRSENKTGHSAWSEPRTFTTIRGNKAPVVVAPIPDQQIREGDPPIVLSLSGLFFDPDDDALQIAVSSSDPAVVEALLTENMLSLTPFEPGSASIQVVADDGQGTQTTSSFLVQVIKNNTPELVDNINDISVVIGAEPVSIELSSLFQDLDGDALEFQAQSSDPDVVLVELLDGRIVISFLSPGSARVELSATELRGGRASLRFGVTIRSNAAPLVVRPFPDLEFLPDADSTIVDLLEHFLDPDDDLIHFQIDVQPGDILKSRLEGTELIFSSRRPGRAVVTISARDDYGGTVVESFQVKIDRQVALMRSDETVPVTFGLRVNYPNPLRLSTTIPFDLPEPVHVRLSVYSTLGSEVAVVYSGPLEAGRYTLQWKPVGLASGVYVYRLRAGAFRESRLLLLLR